MPTSPAPANRRHHAASSRLALVLAAASLAAAGCERHEPADTSAPESVAPESAAPERVAPESAAPESAASEIVAPENAAPESAASESVAPENAAPESAAPAGGEDRPVVLTTFYPTEYFTARLAGDLVTVACPVPEGEDPIFWMPDDETVARYQAADLIVLNGADFAKWVGKVSLPENRMVDTAAGFAEEFIRYKHAVTHSHGDDGEHSHEGLDGHTWVDPVNALRQAEAIRAALEKQLPGESARLEAGAAALRADLEELDARFREIATRLGDRPLLASHPAYNYPARRYGWNLENLDLDPEEMPDDETIASIRELLESHPAELLLWEGDPLPEIAARLRDELGIESIVFSPCELLETEARDAGEDFLTVMHGNLDRLEAALQGDGEGEAGATSAGP